MKKLLVLLTFVVLLFAFAIPTAAESVETLAEDALVYEGIQARLKGDIPGIRSLYTVSDAKIAALEAQGYTVVYGGIMGIADYYGTAYNTYETLTVTYENGEAVTSAKGGKAVAVYVTGGGGSEAYTSRDAEAGTKSFAFTTMFGGNAYQTKESFTGIALCYRGYLLVLDGEGNTVYTKYDAVPEDTVWKRGGVRGNVSVHTVADYFTTHSVEESIQYNKLLHTVLRVCKDAEMTGTCHCVVNNSFRELATVTNARAGIYAFSYKGEMTYGSGWNCNLCIRNVSIGNVDYSSKVAPSAEIAENGNDWKENVMYVYLQDGTNLLQIKATGGGTVTEWRLTLLEGTEVRAESDISLPYAADTATSTVLNAPANTGLEWTIVNYSKNGKIRHKVTARESGAYEIYAVGSMSNVTM